MSILRKIAGNVRQQELGFGNNATTNNRVMNSDGSFNVKRQSLSIWDNTYYYLITMPGWAFLSVVVCSFVLINMFFASLYIALGIEHLNGVPPGGWWHNFMWAYFFSSQTLTTVGYGHVSPGNLPTNIVASFESFLGLLTFALVSGLLYGRFSRPSARLVFSENVLIAPYRVGRGLMIRMGNARKSELVETEAQMILMANQRDENGNVIRKFYTLPLEISKVSFFSLSWTIVHALNDDSPLAGFSEQDFLEANVEILVLVKGVDETNHQLTYARRSYSAEEVVWNARFKPVIGRTSKGMPHMMTRQLGVFEKLDQIGA
ncbi:MAG TPA: ion channel [Saprospiraceae bacterium]|nr:ion channel [Saprospiraceae bacterium]